MHAYTASGRFTVRGLDRKVEGVGKQEKSPRAPAQHAGLAVLSVS